ncbi:MAG: hypothetical protein KKF30_04160 [Proteobacteria bacterium]|nr:hypothetical protein [Pseudomonadota bacterium]MBU4469085.1 hypothetical protein [Pseudomonadota bacterium]MCG2751057.1 hypothetical protein [Desulfobacteraceae bacterium]
MAKLCQGWHAFARTVSVAAAMAIGDIFAVNPMVLLSIVMVPNYWVSKVK